MTEKKRDLRIVALRRFATAITLLNVLGHTVFGFEQSWAQPIVALLAAYLLEILLETIEARGRGKAPRYQGGLEAFFNFLLPAHITGLAVSMLLYANDRLMPIVFAAACAVASKYLFRATVGEKKRHFMNPSNFGIAATLLLFPWVGIAQPYMFTENLDGWGDWFLPALIVCSGTFLNATLTKKIPMILAWVGVFALQAALRHLLFDTSFTAALLPMTGMAFLLFTFYMVTDPGTTPRSVRGQVAFGAAVALGYGMLITAHVVFGIFFSLTAVCAVRGAMLSYEAVPRTARAGRAGTELAVPSPTTLGA